MLSTAGGPTALLLLQLLGGILDVDSSYVSVVDELELSQCFFEFLTLDHPNNNVHNIRLCRQLVVSGCIDTQQLGQLKAADKVGWWEPLCRGGGQRGVGVDCRHPSCQGGSAVGSTATTVDLLWLSYSTKGTGIATGFGCVLSRYYPHRVNGARGPGSPVLTPWRAGQWL